MLTKSNYPSKFIDRTFQHCLLETPRSQNSDMKYVSAPYVKGATERINRVLKSYKYQMGGKPSDNLKSEIKANLKDAIAPTENSNLVYKVTCKDCSSTYFGETTKNLSTWITQHKYCFRTGDNRSQIFRHMIENNHVFDLNETSIVANETRLKPRKFLETYFSLKDPNSINRYDEISDTFLSLILIDM